LYKDGDIRTWLLANLGKDPLDLLVLETRQGTDEGQAATLSLFPVAINLFDLKVWHRFGSAESVEDDIHTKGNEATDDTDDYNDNNFDYIIIVDDRGGISSVTCT